MIDIEQLAYERCKAIEERDAAIARAEKAEAERDGYRSDIDTSNRARVQEAIVTARWYGIAAAIWRELHPGGTNDEWPASPEEVRERWNAHVTDLNRLCSLRRSTWDRGAAAQTDEQIEEIMGRLAP